PPPAKLRTSDVSTDWLRAKLKGAWISELDANYAQGILKLAKADGEFTLLFGYKEGQLHFYECTKLTDAPGWLCHQSYNGKSNQENEIDANKIFDSVSINEGENAFDIQEEWFDKNEKTIFK